MINKVFISLILILLVVTGICNAQQISKEELIFLTPEWKG